jgi:hypothetical protein
MAGMYIGGDSLLGHPVDAGQSLRIMIVRGS